MTKILSTASTNSTLASALNATAEVFHALASSAVFSLTSRSSGLPARLRYDHGELDINPDCMRDANPGASTTMLYREILRRGF